MFTSKMKLNLSLAFVIVLILQFIGNATVLSEDNDIIYLKKDPTSTKAQVNLSDGVITSMDFNYLVYENKAGKKRYRPWEIEWIRFGGVESESDRETLSAAVQLLQNGTWEKAAKILAIQLKHTGKDTTGPVWNISKKERRAMVLYTTYYYHGYAMLQQGLEKQAIAAEAYKDVIKAFPIGLSLFASTKRQQDFEKNPEKLEQIKTLVKEAIEEVQAKLSNQANPDLDSKIEEYLEKIAAVDNTESLETGVSKFMDVCTGFFKADFTAAIDILKEPFLQTSLDSQALDFNKYKPMMFFDTKLAIAQAYFGLREFDAGVSEISGSFVSNSKSNIIKPSLKEIVFDAAKNDKDYFNYLIEGYKLVAKAYESKPDFKEAENYYKQILRTLDGIRGFESVENDTKLSIALCQAKKGKTEEAVETLDKLLGSFKTDVQDIKRKWDNDNLIDSTRASLYMGVYLTYGEVYYDTYSRSNDKKDLYAAFEAYQKVTSYFASDDNKRAKALYWLTRIAKEIATTYFSNYANQKAQLPDGKINPYKYYMNISSQYKTELKKHYPYSEWASM